MAKTSQRSMGSSHFGPDSKLADRSMDRGAAGAGPLAVNRIPNPPKAVAKSYAYKDGVGSTTKGTYGIPSAKGGRTGEQ